MYSECLNSSNIVEGKKRFLKNHASHTSLDCFPLQEIFYVRINEKWYFGDCDFSIL